MSASPTQPLTEPPASTDRSWDWFALLLLVAVCAIVSYVIYARLLAESNLTLILGIILGWVGTVVNYKWGSSAGSKVKDQTISRLS